MSTTAAVRVHVDTGLFGAINAEWRTLSHRAPAAPDGAPWDLPSPAETLQQIIDTLNTVDGDYATADALLHSLLTRHRSGDDLAGRVVLQAMLGRCMRHVPTAFGRGLDGESEALASMWTSIATYPLHRTTRVAMNLAMDALRHLQAAQNTLLAVGDASEVSECRNDPYETLSGLSGPPSSDEASKVILWGLDNDVITSAEAKMLAAFYLGDGWNSSTPSTAAERKRRNRAVRKLALAASQLL